MFAYYTIQRGDTLRSIADKFGTNTELLQKVNGIQNPDRINAGDLLIVPIIGWKPPEWWRNGMVIFELPGRDAMEGLFSQTQVVPEEEKEPGCITYIVEDGDTLNTIARRIGTTVNILKHLNGQEVLNNLKTGSVICVPDTENTYVYVVRPGDSVYMIAKRFNVPVERILRVNYMNAEDIILPGMQLVIPF